MTKLFNKLPGFTQTPPGLEWVLFRKLPILFLMGSLLVCLPMAYLYFFLQPIDLEKQKTMYMLLGLLFSYWFFVGAAAIGCVVVMIMKGPAYVADAYMLPKENPALENKADNLFP